MAKIDEERILLRFSTLIPDSGSVSDYTIITESIRANIETQISEYISDELDLDPMTANIQVIVEANIIPVGSNI